MISMVIDPKLAHHLAILRLWPKMANRSKWHFCLAV
jgi:hypothetical protein